MPLRDGEVSVQDAAHQLGVSRGAIYDWLTKGQLPGRRAPSGRWCIPWDPATQAAYRRRVAASFRLKQRPQGGSDDRRQDF